MTKKKPVNAPRVRLSKTDLLIATTIQDHTHHSTLDVQRKRTVVMAEVNAADNEIVELSARLSTVRALKVNAEAKIYALTNVIGRREK